jgi:membrane fusion protein, multidrug efflux system
MRHAARARTDTDTSSAQSLRSAQYAGPVRGKRLLALVAGAALAASACGADGPAQGAAPAGAPPGIPVEVAAAIRDTVIETILAPGAVEAVQSIELRPETEGRLVEIMASEGREVARGTPLFRIDGAELRAQVARQEAERDLAVQTLNRTRDLLGRNAAAAADLERAEASARSAEAQLALLRLRLERTLVRAPFAGVVGGRLVSLGDYVTSATRLTTLQTVNPQRIAFTVPERHARRLDVGQRVAFRVAAVPAREFVGRVDFVDPQVQLPGRTILVKALVENPDRLLQRGMFIEAALAVEVRPDALLVPEDAILPVAGGNHVWVVQDGEATRRPVQLGVRIPGFVEVVAGLDGEPDVVVGGVERLSEGSRVEATAVQRARPVAQQPSSS